MPKLNSPKPKHPCITKRDRTKAIKLFHALVDAPVDSGLDLTEEEICIIERFYLLKCYKASLFYRRRFVDDYWLPTV